MNDDERLTALFRDAASDTNAPPPSFGHDDVVATSRRITARRRSAAVAAAVTIGLVGMGAAIVLPGQLGESPTTAAAPLNAPEAAGQREADEAADSGAEAGAAGLGSAPAEPPATAPAPVPAPLGPGRTECADRQDPALRALVEQVLPEVSTAPAAATADVCLPGEQRYLALEVADRGVPGVLSVSYLPPGTIPQLAPGALSAPTASGGTVIVASSTEVADAIAPFADRLPELVEFLAPRL
jgi:hypothetical protein